MDDQELLDYLDIPFTFHKRPNPIEPQIRVVWGLSILVLILFICSRGKKSSISRLHFLSWAVRSPENRTTLIEFLENRNSPALNLVQHDPSFDRAIKYAIAEKLVDTDNGKVLSLTSSGKSLAEQIMKLHNCLEEEKNILTQKGASVNETLTKKILSQKTRY